MEDSSQAVGARVDRGVMQRPGGAQREVMMNEATAHAMQYLTLTDAMGYKSGQQGLSPEEFAEALRKDAERYRWLRDKGSNTWVPFTGQWKMDAEHCNAAIDNEISTQRLLGAA